MCFMITLMYKFLKKDSNNSKIPTKRLFNKQYKNKTAIKMQRFYFDL